MNTHHTLLLLALLGATTPSMAGPDLPKNLEPRDIKAEVKPDRNDPNAMDIKDSEKEEFDPNKRSADQAEPFQFLIYPGLYAPLNSKMRKSLSQLQKLRLLYRSALTQCELKCELNDQYFCISPKKMPAKPTCRFENLHQLNHLESVDIQLPNRKLSFEVASLYGAKMLTKIEINGPISLEGVPPILEKINNSNGAIKGQEIGEIELNQIPRLTEKIKFLEMFRPNKLEIRYGTNVEYRKKKFSNIIPALRNTDCFELLKELSIYGPTLSIEGISFLHLPQLTIINIPISGHLSSKPFDKAKMPNLTEIRGLYFVDSFSRTELKNVLKIDYPNKPFEDIRMWVKLQTPNFKDTTVNISSKIFNQILPTPKMTSAMKNRFLELKMDFTN